MNLNSARFLFAAIFAVVLLSPFLIAQATGVYGSSSTLGVLRIKNESYYSPFPSEPGKYVDVWIAVRNFGKSAINAECKLVPVFPFSLDDANDALRDLGVIDIQQDVLLKFHVRVDENAVEGYNDLDFECRDKNGGLYANWSSEALKIYVQPQDAVLSIESARSSPEEVSPGGKAVVEISISNLAQVSLKDIRVKIDLSSEKIPFVPAGGTSEAKIARLAFGERQTVSFGVLASSSAASGVYKVPIQLAYFDKLGKAYSKNETIGLVVSSLPEVQVLASSDKILRPGTRGKISLKIINNGLSDVKLAWVAFSPSARDVTLLSSSQAYVGSVSSDNYETVDFDVYVEKNASLPLSLPVLLSFRDDSNKQYSIQASPALPVISAEEADRIELDGPKGVSIFVIAIGAIALFYLLAKFVWPAIAGLFARRKKSEE